MTGYSFFRLLLGGIVIAKTPEYRLSASHMVLSKQLISFDAKMNVNCNKQTVDCFCQTLWFKFGNGSRTVSETEALGCKLDVSIHSLFILQWNRRASTQSCVWPFKGTTFLFWSVRQISAISRLMRINK